MDVAASRAMIYVVGGAEISPTPPYTAGELIESYDANTDTWEVLPSTGARTVSLSRQWGCSFLVPVLCFLDKATFSSASISACI